MTPLKTKKELLLTIEQVSELVDVARSTLRYWERVFPEYLVPARTIGGRRRYSSDDVNRVLEVHRLLRTSGYTIAGARKVLEIK